MNEDIRKAILEKVKVAKGNRSKITSDFKGFCLREGEPSSDGKESEYAVLEGKAIAYESDTILYQDEFYGERYEVHEIISRGAIDSSTDMSDVVLDVNHDCISGNSLPIARTSAGTLTLKPWNKEGDEGYGFEARINKANPRTMQVAEDVKEGLANKCSFAFYVDDGGSEERDYVRKDKNVDGAEIKVNVIETRINHIAKVADVSVVTWPAYQATEVSLSQRSVQALEKAMEREREASEREAQRKKTEELRKAVIARIDGATEKGEKEDAHD